MISILGNSTSLTDINEFYSMKIINANHRMYNRLYSIFNLYLKIIMKYNLNNVNNLHICTTLIEKFIFTNEYVIKSWNIHIRKIHTYINIQIILEKKSSRKIL